MNADEASQIQQYNGQVTIATAGAGSAEGDITFTNKLVIDNSGYVTKPLQPTASFGWDANIATTTIIPASVILVNIGSHLTSAGRFTAPIAGTYWYGFTGMSEDASANFKIELRKNGSLVNNSTRAYSHTIAYSHATTMGFITLAASDYLEFYNAVAPLHSYYGQGSFQLVA